MIAFLWLAFIKRKKKARSEQGVKGQESVESCTQHVHSRDMNGQGDMLHVTSGGQNHLALLLQDCRRPLELFETNQVSSSCLIINLFILYFSHSSPPFSSQSLPPTSSLFPRIPCFCSTAVMEQHSEISLRRIKSTSLQVYRPVTRTGTFHGHSALLKDFC